jgi:5-methyltetrahydrofolate--homocysteine methyltransferase
VLTPALDEVGARFEKGTFFLPQLMASAEAAKAGFTALRETADRGDVPSKGTIVLATVKGDIHDIGKNIVRTVLENYGYTVIDLGRDVPAETVVETAIREDIKLVGLSALMTTTVSSMADTIAALRRSGHDCRIMVGGAVLTPEYAVEIGADYYAKDAKQSADIARLVLG